MRTREITAVDISSSLFKSPGAKWPAQVCFASFQLAEMDEVWSAADQNSEQTFTRKIDMPESAFMNPFQLFPITWLSHFG